MSRMRARVTMPPPTAFDRWRRDSEHRIEAAMLIATEGAARSAKETVRDRFGAAKLAGLGRALGHGGDMSKHGQVQRRGSMSRASGWLFVRSQSERTIGAIEAYTEGAEIAPVRGRWLWIATKEIPQRAGRYRMTPARYRAGGFEQRIGPLHQIRSINGYPLLVVRDATVSAAGILGKAKRRNRNGGIPKGQREKGTIVAFIGIPRTSRTARVDVQGIVAAERATLPARIRNQLSKGIR